MPQVHALRTSAIGHQRVRHDLEPDFQVSDRSDQRTWHCSSADDFCLWAPPSNRTRSRDALSLATAPVRSPTVPVHSDYVQVTGVSNFTQDEHPRRRCASAAVFCVARLTLTAPRTSPSLHRPTAPPPRVSPRHCVASLLVCSQLAHLERHDKHRQRSPPRKIRIAVAGTLLVPDVLCLPPLQRTASSSSADSLAALNPRAVRRRSSGSFGAAVRRMRSPLSLLPSSGSGSSLSDEEEREHTEEDAEEAAYVQRARLKDAVRAPHLTRLSAVHDPICANRRGTSTPDRNNPVHSRFQCACGGVLRVHELMRTGRARRVHDSLCGRSRARSPWAQLPRWRGSWAAWWGDEERKRKRKWTHLKRSPINWPTENVRAQQVELTCCVALDRKKGKESSGCEVELVLKSPKPASPNKPTLQKRMWGGAITRPLARPVACIIAQQVDVK
ncbi:hypothetical protein B0H19DRAFT_1060697 [Mycena capillaripes]|nr:hypothetical protein B0H19DRAFT_1060697 [Mycena capillaripes]